MADLAKCVRIAAELESAREVAKRLFGAEYAAKVEPWRELVREVMREASCGAVQVPLRMQEVGALPANPLLLFAAVVEECEAGAAFRNTGGQA